MFGTHVGRNEEANIQISSLKTKLENVKKPGAVVKARTSTVHAVPFNLQSRTSCGWLWNASHVVIPLFNDTDSAPGAKAREGCLSQFNLAALQPKAATLVLEAPCEIGPRGRHIG